MAALLAFARFYMKLSHCVVLVAVAALVSSCGDNETQVQQPAKGPAVVGGGTNAVTKVTVTPAPPPPVTPAKPATTLFPAGGAANATSAKTPDAVAKAPGLPADGNTPASEAKPKLVRASAKVVMVKMDPDMKFVVLEFFTTEVPTVGSQITLYRGKERVATVKATEPMKPPLVTADILDGEPRKGDEVR